MSRDTKEKQTANLIGLVVRHSIMAALQLAAHIQCHKSACAQIGLETLESGLTTYAQWIADPTKRPAGTTDEGVNRAHRRTQAALDIIKKLSQKSGVIVKSATVFLDTRPQALANGTQHAANVGIATAWLTSPLEDAVLLPHLEAILAHEFGHARLSHIPKRAYLSAASTFLSQAFLCWEEVRAQMKADQTESQMIQWRAHCLFAVFAWAFKHRIDKVLSRFQEFQADAWGASWTSPQQMAAALEFLRETFGSSVYANPLHWLREGSKLTHPTHNLRIKRMQTPGIEHKTVWGDPKCWLTW